MKALTLTQPYASLIACGAKRIETRGWATSYRGWLAIHAGQGLKPVGGEQGLRDLLRLNDPICHALRDAHPDLESNSDICAALPRGAVIAITTLVDVVRLTAESPYRYERAVGDRVVRWELSKDEVAMGDYRPGRCLWLLADTYPLVHPAWCKGKQGLWDWEATR
jgi:hypothetical protein